MTEISIWQGTIEPSHPLLDPNRLATNIFDHAVQLFTKLSKSGEIFSEPDIHRRLIEQKDRYKLWGNDFDASEGGLDEHLVGTERMRDTLLPILCRMTEALITMARHIGLEGKLEAVFQQFEELKIQVQAVTAKHAPIEEDSDDEHPGRSMRSLPAISLDDFSSSESEGSSYQEMSEIQESLINVEHANDLLFRLGPTLYDNAERLANKWKIPNPHEATIIKSGEMMQTCKSANGLERAGNCSVRSGEI